MPKFGVDRNKEPLVLTDDDGVEHVAKFNRANVAEWVRIDSEKDAFIKKDKNAAEEAGATYVPDVNALRQFNDRMILSVFEQAPGPERALEELEPAVTGELLRYVAAMAMGMEVSELDTIIDAVDELDPLDVADEPVFPVIKDGGPEKNMGAPTPIHEEQTIADMENSRSTKEPVTSG